MKVSIVKKLYNESWTMDINLRIEMENSEREKLKAFGELFDEFQEKAYRLTKPGTRDNKFDVTYDG